MKNLKKIASLALALIMALAMMAPALAAESTYSITIESEDGTPLNAGHTYEAYQIFTGDLSTDSTGKAVLSNVKWGEGVTYTEDQKVAYPADSEEKTAAQIADGLTDETMAKAFATFIAEYLSTTATGSANTVSDGKYEISNLAPGYYLVKDKDSSLPNDDNKADTYTGYILEVVGDVTVNPKLTDIPVDAKTAKDKQDAEKKAVDASVGDVVPFILKAALPNTVTEYTNGYKLVFTDTLTNLELDRTSVQIKVGDNVVVANNNISPYMNFDEASNTLTITIQDVTKEPFYATNNSIVTVEYKATLTAAAITADKAENKFVLQYSNNPHGDGLGTGKPHIVPVYSYTIQVIKVDGKNVETKLPGAIFKLYKKSDDDTKQYAVVDANGKITSWNETGTDLTTDANGLINIDGLGSGTYYLEEIQAPTGYNKLTEDITVVITGDAENKQVSATVNGEPAIVTPVETDTTVNAIIPAQIENNGGAQLPSTGGIGTTIFYLIGGILVAGAAILLVTRKRVREQ